MTIIILLILARITLATLTGNNGLFSRSKEARKETQKAQATDIVNLKITNMQINSWAENEQMPTLQYLADGFCQDKEMQYVELKTQKTASFLLPKIDASKSESIFVKLKEYPYEFEINKSLQLASIDGEKITDTGSNSDNINSEQYQAMLSTMSDMQKEIETLKTNLAYANNQINSNKDELNRILTSVDVNTRTTLFSSNSVTSAGSTLTLNDDISKYKYIIIYVDALSDNGWYGKSSRLINTSDISLNNNTELKPNCDFSISEWVTQSYYFGFNFWFKDYKNIQIYTVNVKNYYGARIYKIEGIN